LRVKSGAAIELHFYEKRLTLNKWDVNEDEENKIKKFTLAEDSGSRLVLL